MLLASLQENNKMKKSTLAAIKPIKQSGKKMEEDPGNPTKSPSAISKSLASQITTPSVTKSAFAGAGVTHTSPGNKDKNFNNVRKPELGEVGEYDEMSTQSKSRKLAERKMEMGKSDSAAGKVITLSETDSGDVKPSSNSLNQLCAQQEMALSKVANANESGYGSTMVLAQDGMPESSGCPLEKVLEFLEAVMTKNYKRALELAKEVQAYEPNNELVKDYMSVLGGLTEKEDDSEESSSEEDSDSTSSSSDETSTESDTDGSWGSCTDTSADDDDRDHVQVVSLSSSAPLSNKSKNTRKCWKP